MCIVVSEALPCCKKHLAPVGKLTCQRMLPSSPSTPRGRRTRIEFPTEARLFVFFTVTTMIIYSIHKYYEDQNDRDLNIRQRCCRYIESKKLVYYQIIMKMNA